MTKPLEQKRNHLARLFQQQDGKCHICGQMAVLDYEGGKAGRPMSAVRFRLGSAFGAPGRVRKRVMVHRKCSQDRSAQIVESQPIEEIRMRSGRIQTEFYSLTSKDHFAGRRENASPAAEQQVDQAFGLARVVTG